MAVIVKMDMPEGCIYYDKEGKTTYCPLCNHDKAPFCMYTNSVGGLNEIGIGERPWGCPIEAELEEDDVLYLIEKRRIHK